MRDISFDLSRRSEFDKKELHVCLRQRQSKRFAEGLLEIMYLVMDEAEELLHPFWLGLLMLFGVIIVMGSICFLRRRCGSNFYHWFNRVRGRDDLNNGRRRDRSDETLQ